MMLTPKTLQLSYQLVTSIVQAQPSTNLTGGGELGG